MPAKGDKLDLSHDFMRFIFNIRHLREKLGSFRKIAFFVRECFPMKKRGHKSGQNKIRRIGPMEQTGEPTAREDPIVAAQQHARVVRPYPISLHRMSKSKSPKHSGRVGALAHRRRLYQK